MDPEEDPFETPLEREYNRVLGEMAQQKLECEAKVQELKREVAKNSGCFAGNGSGSGSSGTQFSEDHEVFGDHAGESSGDGGLGEQPGSNQTLFSGGNRFLRNSTTHLNDTTSSGGASFNSSGPSQQDGFPAFNHTTFPCPGNVTVPDSHQCPPCPTLPDSCGPTTTPHGDSGSTMLATPEAVLVGAAAAVLILVLAAAVTIIIRYLPNITAGLLIVSIIVLVWYCSSKYPEAARRLGARAWEALRDAARAIVDRVLRRNNSEVSAS
jgi:hypothetical protein